MNNIYSYYTKYRNHIDEYKRWENTEKNTVKHTAYDKDENKRLKKKAEIIAEPLLLSDKYEHEKAEDSETFFQTLNIELMSVTGVLCSLPIAITKVIPFLDKHADKNKAAKKASEILTKYKNTSFNIAGKNISAPKAATIFSAIGSMIFFACGIKNSMQSQLGLIRKSSFDATQNIIDNPKLFAELTPEQEKQVNLIAGSCQNNGNGISDKIKDKVDINSSFKAVNEYKKTHREYEEKKSAYFNDLNKNSNKPLSANQIKEANEDKMLFESLLKNVEHDVLEPLRKVETISNIAYSALFTGGFLEYLVSDKLVQVLGVKNKFLAAGIKIGAPLLTYLILNKNISNIENKAILAEKYKYLKQFTENPLQYSKPKEEEKENPIKFIKTVYHDMKEYDKFSREELPKIEKRLDAKKQIKLTEKQEKDAKRLQKNTAMVINTQREELYNQSVGIKSLSETILGPIDVIATAAGGLIGNNLSKKFPNGKFSGLYTGLGAVAAFIPAAIIEAKLTKQQKLSEKIAVMNSIKNLQDTNKFADYNNSSVNIPYQIMNKELSPAFKEFSKNY